MRQQMLAWLPTRLASGTTQSPQVTSRPVTRESIEENKMHRVVQKQPESAEHMSSHHFTIVTIFLAHSVMRILNKKNHFSCISFFYDHA